MAPGCDRVIAPLERLAANPLVQPSQISYTRASGTFNPGATVDHASGKIVLLVRVFEEETRRSSIALALSSDGEVIDEIRDRPAIGREEPYEEWGVEDARVTWLEKERRYAITYTGYSPAGPMPRIVCVRVPSLESSWPVTGVTLVGPRPGTWRSSRVGAGAPPIRTSIGWLFPFHGATAIEEGNIYSMGWCVLDLKNPNKVLYVSDSPALTPDAPYEIEHRVVPQVDPANFITGIRVVFPQGLVERGDDLFVYYGAADVSIGGARVRKQALIASLAEAIERKQGGVPL